MAEIVNLRQARKRAARGKAEALADINRAAFGLPKELRSAARADCMSRSAREGGLGSEG